MSEPFSTDRIRTLYSMATRWQQHNDIGKAEAEFDRWLNKLKAEIWAEGFDAGERDVWEHEHNENGWDKDCIPNPYK